MAKVCCLRVLARVCVCVLSVPCCGVLWHAALEAYGGVWASRLVHAVLTPQLLSPVHMMCPHSYPPFPCCLSFRCCLSHTPGCGPERFKDGCQQGRTQGSAGGQDGITAQPGRKAAAGAVHWRRLSAAAKTTTAAAAAGGRRCIIIRSSRGISIIFRGSTSCVCRSMQRHRQRQQQW